MYVIVWVQFPQCNSCLLINQLINSVFVFVPVFFFVFQTYVDENDGDVVCAEFPHRFSSQKIACRLVPSRSIVQWNVVFI